MQELLFFGVVAGWLIVVQLSRIIGFLGRIERLTEIVGDNQPERGLSMKDWPR
jgi:hypothetical protein